MGWWSEACRCGWSKRHSGVFGPLCGQTPSLWLIGVAAQMDAS